MSDKIEILWNLTNEIQKQARQSVQQVTQNKLNAK